MMQHANVTAAVVNSTKKPNIEKFRQYCKGAYVHRLISYPFHPINESVQRILSHCCDKMEEIDAGLGQLSETCLESQVGIFQI